jgi:hypothetical protein
MIVENPIRGLEIPEHENDGAKRGYAGQRRKVYDPQAPQLPESEELRLKRYRDRKREHRDRKKVYRAEASPSEKSGGRAEHDGRDPKRDEIELLYRARREQGGRNGKRADFDPRFCCAVRFLPRFRKARILFVKPCRRVFAKREQNGRLKVRKKPEPVAYDGPVAVVKDYPRYDRALRDPREIIVARFFRREKQIRNVRRDFPNRKVYRKRQDRGPKKTRREKRGVVEACDCGLNYLVIHIAFPDLGVYYYIRAEKTRYFYGSWRARRDDGRGRIQNDVGRGVALEGGFGKADDDGA